MSLELAIVVFAGAAAVIGLAGTTLVRDADAFADRTGLGEALVGAVLLGAITSLAGSILSVTAALDGRPALAFSNAVGGIAVQTVFLVVADLSYRRVNLEHAAASLPNIVSASLLVVLLATALGGAFVPDVTVAGVHPVSAVLVVGYLLGLRLVHVAREGGAWRALRTEETVLDEGSGTPATGAAAPALAARIAALAMVVGAAGWALAKAGGTIAAQTGITQTATGALLTATATSLPELVTTLAAVRRGALALAVGGIVGGNTFDVLFLAFSDVAYRPGSLYHAVGDEQLLVLVMALVMTGVVSLGLLARERRGVANIGGEGVVIVALYLLTLGLVAFD